MLTEDYDTKLKRAMFAHINKISAAGRRVSKVALRTYFLEVIDKNKAMLNDVDALVAWATMMVEEHGT